MSMKTKYLFLLLPLLLTTACSDDVGDNNDKRETPYREVALPAETRGLVESSNEFAFNFAKEHFKMFRESDAISPFNIFINLAMLANADDGEVRKEIMHALSVDEHDIRDLNNFCNTMLTELPALDAKTDFVCANSLWSTNNPKYQVLPEYQNILESTFKGEIHNAFNDKSLLKETANKWIEDKTYGFIKNFLEDEVDWALISTAYFKGTWTQPFDKSLNQINKFYNYDGTESDATFMYNETSIGGFEDDEHSVVAIPYGNSNFSMAIMLPEEGISVDKMLEKYDSDKFRTLTNNIKGNTYKVRLWLPKFSIGPKTDIKFILKNLGISSLFDKGLTKLFSQPTAIDNMLHETRIEVDETGTVAAAATGAVIVGGALARGEFKVDHPFAFVIY